MKIQFTRSVEHTILREVLEDEIPRVPISNEGVVLGDRRYWVKAVIHDLDQGLIMVRLIEIE